MKTMIGPLVAFAALMIGAIFHITIDDSTQTAVVDSIGLIATAGYTLYGIIKNHFPNKQ